MKPKALTLRSVLIAAFANDVDLDKPLVIRLGLFDNRCATIRAHDQREHALILTLDDTTHFQQRSMDEQDAVLRSMRPQDKPERLDFGWRS